MTSEQDKLFPSPIAKKNGKKGQCSETRPGNPLPIPLKDFGPVKTGASTSPGDDWPLYRATLIRGRVVVTDTDDARALHQNGYFGSGSLSVRGLEHGQLCKRVTQSQLHRKGDWRAHYDTLVGNSSYIPRKHVYVLPDDSPAADQHDSAVHRQEGQVTLGDALCVDAFPVNEPLTLLPEEAVYLCFGLCCLLVTDHHTGRQLNVDELWVTLLEQDLELVYKYAAYHSLRSKGWIVRPALQYGADYMLYAVGPSYYHSQYLVLVTTYDAVALTEIRQAPAPHAAFLHAADRAASSVKKMFMICMVLQAGETLRDLFNIRDCMDKLHIEELPFTRLNIDNFCNPEQEGDASPVQ